MQNGAAVGQSMRQVEDAVAHADRSMRQLRDSMRGIQIRTAGFKKSHDEAARQVARAVTDLMEAAAASNRGR